MHSIWMPFELLSLFAQYYTDDVLVRNIENVEKVFKMLPEVSADNNKTIEPPDNSEPPKILFIVLKVLVGGDKTSSK